MKTSYLLLLFALLILFGTTAAYDIALQKAYLKRDYEKPYADYDQLNFKNFDKIEIVSANLVSTMITQGSDFNVKLHKGSQDAHIEQKGTTLVITFKTNNRGYYSNHSNALIIQCPFLREVKTDAIFTVNGKIMTARHERSGRYSGGKVSVRGFEQDTLSLVMNNFTTLYFKDNKFKFLDASLGSGDSSRSSLYIDNSNEILSASLDLQHRSLINLKDIYIKDFKYKLSDSAQVSLSGISLRLLSNK